MTYFLEHLAHHIYGSYSDCLEKQCLVFPNRRAGLYFIKYLSGVSGKPVWAPAIVTVNDLFSSFSKLQIAENDTLIFELYRVYRLLNPEAEGFDEFYYWGDMLINDFDDVDKYLVNPDRLYSNLADIRKIDSEFGDLTEDQKLIIKQFWTNFNVDSPTSQKKDFLTIWSVLPELYKKFRNALRSKGIAYEGMVFRDLAELSVNGFPLDHRWDMYHFIGFNALSNCEILLMKTLKKEQKAKFYWDFDNSYVDGNKSHAAGYFIRQNLNDFGNDMPEDWNYNTLLSGKDQVIRRKVVDTSSDIAQVKFVASLLSKMENIGNEDAHHTAIVLSDENLLIPMLSSIPEAIEDINVTMGYPLRFSPVYSLVKQLLALQRNCRTEGQIVLFDHKDVLTVLKHNFFADSRQESGSSIVTDLIKENNQWIASTRFQDDQQLCEIFRKVAGVDALSAYLKNILESFFSPGVKDEDPGTNPVSDINIRNEFIYRTLLALNRLDSVIESFGFGLTPVTYSRLLDRLLKGLSIPFSGEPLKGIQVMGILETRSLDFRNLIITSVNEGTMPRGSAGTSYIPYNLREAFGLPTLRHQDSIYAYYFYRLLHRAENVTFIYNSNSEGLRTGEMSRFLLQLNYLEGNLDFSALRYTINIPGPAAPAFPKSESDIEKLERTYLEPGLKTLSPSAVNMWLYCRMKFYYRYVCGFKEPEEIVTEIDPALFGEILHSVMERIYAPFRNAILYKSSIYEIEKNNERINLIISEIVNEKFHGGTELSISGNDRMIISILYNYVKMILRYDASFDNLKIIDLERYVESEFTLQFDKRKAGIKIGGIIDRLDQCGTTLRILDYKTGNISMNIHSVESLFDTTDESRNEAWFQVLLYCAVFQAGNGSINLRPSVYALRKLNDPGFSDKLLIKSGRSASEEVSDYRQVHNEIISRLTQVIETIFSKNEPFNMTGHKRKCSFCPYRQLCGR